MQQSFTSHQKQSFLYTESSSIHRVVSIAKPFVVWLTGLSGAGKTTLGNQLFNELKEANAPVILLDGDIIRQGLCSDLGFTQQDRDENIRRVAEVSKLMTAAGLIVIVAFISPTIIERDVAKHIIGRQNFVEVHVSASIKACIERDPKGLYKKALAGQIKNFTGIDAPYEVPIAPEIRIDTEQVSVETATAEILYYLKTNKFI
ncbi:adenylyl-sulfate kinase [Hydrotalea sp.]|uniref:adenylyl-sulfate kinase n=1 Tax=Hydrotalea sp. TaxID=2881279 RepID=UPI00258AF753|nr:adenylyl-sulfate kinase [Hydrotalea sp.]